MSIDEAIARANAILPGQPAPDGEQDPRWQAIIEVGEYIKTNPDEVWSFAAHWGCHEQDDLRMAITTCLLEHLLEYHFGLIFPRVEQLSHRDSFFADTFCSCWKFGESTRPENSARVNRLKDKIRQRLDD